MTQEQKQAILEAYQNRENTVKQIAEKYKTNRKTITQIVIEQGGEPRRPNALGKRGKAKKCPKCRKKIEVKGAIYCCFCGADIRSKRDLLIERIEKAFGIIKFLPDNERDNVQQLFIDTINELKE